MAVIQARSRRRGAPLLAAGAAVFCLAIGVTAWLIAGGEIRVPFTDPPVLFALERDRDESGPSVPEGKIPVPMAARAIPAYSAVRRDDLWDAEQGQLRIYWMDAANVTDDLLTQVPEILGRVLKRDKPPGYVFTTRDFLPKGTRPGLVAGIPPGKRAMRVELEQLPGLVGLNPGDAFDLLATIPIDGKIDYRGVGGLYAGQLEMEAKFSGAHQQANVRVLVHNGVVVTEAETRVANGARGGQTQSIREVVIAVDPAEVAPLSEALAVEANLSCVPRSGHPDDRDEIHTPERLAQAPFQLPGASEEKGLLVVEKIAGSRRELVPLPAGSTPDDE